MQNIIFVLNTIFNYSLLIVLVYYTYLKTGLYNTLKKPKWVYLNTLYFTSLAIVSSMASRLIFDGTSLDGRLIIILLVGILFDLRVGALTLVLITAFQFIVGNSFVLMSALITLICLVAIHFYMRRKQPLSLKAINVYALGASSMCFVSIWSVLMDVQTQYVRVFKTNLLFSIFLTTNLLTALYFMVKHEAQLSHQIKDLRLVKDDLESQNEEIRALYEEMAAAEATLQDNYDELNDYRWKLEESEKRYERVLTASEAGFLDYYPITKVWFISDQICELLGYDVSEKEYLKHHFFEMIDDEFRSIEVYFITHEVWRHETILSREIKMKTKSGHVKWFLLKALAETDGNKRLVRITGSLLNIHQRKMEQEKVEFYAFHNPVTGFLNEDYFVETIKKFLYPSRDPLMVFYIGIHNVKQIEQVYGTKVVELLQYQLGVNIKNLFTDFSTYAHLRKGVFGIVILEREKHRDSINKAIETLNLMYQKPVLVQNFSIEMNLMYPYYIFEKDVSAEEMIERLNMTLEYCEDQKQVGKLVGFEWDFYNQKTYLKQISYFLTEAVSERLFEVVYQPQYAYDNHIEIIGFEALVRLKHPHYGYISPDVFIPLAEELGLIHKIDLIVLEKACETGQTISKSVEKPVRMSVNISFLDLLNQEYTDHLTEIIDKTGFDSKLLSVEITESVMSNYIESVHENLTFFKENQIEIHLDDFGTGYSSLNHLGRLPVHALKIDKSFVDVMLENEKMYTLVELIIQIGHKLGMSLIAEGIEDVGQLEALKEMGCDYYQGYYLSKPLTKENTLELMDITVKEA